ncbi:MAG: CPBP family intramembrane glutamic endopeptidase [Ilumatobacteraceae bacterium]
MVTVLGPPSRLPPPTGWQAGWYRDPYGYPLMRYYDGRGWTGHTMGVLAARPDLGRHPVLPIGVAFGAVAVLIASLITSRFLLDALVDLEWSIAAYTAISVLVGYGPSVWWCWYASRRWGTRRPARDLGLRFRWADAGWGPIVWISAFAGELVMILLVDLTGIPLVPNTEPIGELDADRTYVIALLIATVVAAPLVEEAVFRGLMLRGLLSRMAVVPAVAVQGVLFGLAHVDPVRGTGNIGLALVLSAVGVVLGGAAYLLRRLGPVIIAHALFNGFVLLIVLLAS